MTRVQWYIAKSIIAKAGAVFLLGISILTMARSLLVVEVVLQQNADIANYGYLLLHFLPHYMGYAAPLALYVGTFETFRRLSQNREVVALSAMGISRLGLALPALGLALATAIYLFVNLGWLDPIGRYEYRKVFHLVETSNVDRLVREKTFTSLDNWTVLPSEIDPDSKVYKSVFAYSETESARVAVLAERAMLAEVDGSFVLTLENGTWLQTSREPPYEEIENTSFESMDVTVASVPGAFRPIGIDEQEFSFPDLVARADQPPPGTDAIEMKAELYRKLGLVFSPFVLAVAGIGLGVWASGARPWIGGFSGLAFVLLYHQLNSMTEVICRDFLWSPRDYFLAVALSGIALAGFLCHRALTPNTGPVLNMYLSRQDRA